MSARRRSATPSGTGFASRTRGRSGTAHVLHDLAASSATVQTLSRNRGSPRRSRGLHSARGFIGHCPDALSQSRLAATLKWAPHAASSATLAIAARRDAHVGEGPARLRMRTCARSRRSAWRPSTADARTTDSAFTGSGSPAHVSCAARRDCLRLLAERSRPRFIGSAGVGRRRPYRSTAGSSAWVRDASIGRVLQSSLAIAASRDAHIGSM
jgi:hypothetical protein